MQMTVLWCKTGENMKTLNIKDIKKVTGAKICKDGECFTVVNPGIPQNIFNGIESNLQLKVDGKISKQQAVSNIYAIGGAPHMNEYTSSFITTMLSVLQNELNTL